jgi:hypothetical protein
VNSKTVVLVHPSRSTREQFSRALAAEYSTVDVSSVEEALDHPEISGASAVIAQAQAVEDGQIERLGEVIPTAAYVLLAADGQSANQPDSLFGKDYVLIREQAGPQAVMAELKKLISPRVSSRHVPHDPHHVEIRTTTGEVIRSDLLDVSNRGLAFRYGLRRSVEALLPGSDVSDINVLLGGVPILQGAVGVVRRVEMLASSKTGSTAELRGYRIAIEFVSDRPAENASEREREKISDPARIGALLRDATGQRALMIQPADNRSKRLPISKVEIVPGSNSLRVQVARSSSALSPGDVVRGTIDLEGKSYSFLTAIAALDSQFRDQSLWHLQPFAISLSFPKVMHCSHRRTSSRFRPRDANAIPILVRAPFSRQVSKREVLDVSTSGLSFAIDYAEDIFPEGSLIPEIRIFAGSRDEVVVRGRVKSLVPLLDNTSGLRHAFKCGIAFEGMSLQDRSKVAGAILATGFPGVEDAFGLTFKEIWGFLHETGFIYPEKEEKLRPFLPKIEETLSTLLTTPNRVFKTLLFRSGPVLQGHLSAVKAYRGTWMMQHLAARKDGRGHLSAARILNQGIMEYLDQNPDMEWIKAYFRPNNKFPARVFGGFAKKLKDPNVSDLRTYNYLVGATLTEEPALPAGVVLRPFTAEDAPRIEKYFVWRNQVTALRSDDLVGRSICLPDVSAQYQSLGLERRREVYIAERNGNMVGFALCEISSLGLNLSELTNHFSVHMRAPDAQAHRALIAHCRYRYGQFGRPTCVGLTENDDLQDYFAAGFAKTKEYMCWTWHRSLYRKYADYISRLFGRDTAPGSARW